MTQYIDKSALVAEIERRLEAHKETLKNCDSSISEMVLKGSMSAYQSFLHFLDTIEVKEVDTWHLQEKEDIYDAVKDWGLYTFACVMKDGTIQKFTGNLDEDCEGHINVHVDGVNDDYDNVDDIVKWIELI